MIDRDQSRAEEARAFLSSWEPDDTVLPDWIVDEIERDPQTKALFDQRFLPWEGAEIGSALVPQRTPIPVVLSAPRPRAARLRRDLLASGAGATGLLLAALALLWLAPGGEAPELLFAELVVLEEAEETEQVFLPPPPPPPPPDRGARAGQDPDRALNREQIRERLRQRKSTREDLHTTHAGGPSTGEVLSKRYRGEDASVRTIAPKDAERQGRWDSPQKVVVTKQNLRILDRVRFSEGSRALSPDAAPLLDSVAQVMKEHPEVSLHVVGHSEALGSDRGGLSLGRANAVRDALLSRGIPPDRLVAEGMGDSQPIDSNTSEAGRANNARVEFVLDAEQPPSPPPPAPIVPPQPINEDYTDYGHRSFEKTDVDPLSTFSIDVDTASYSIVRRKLLEGYLPPIAAVRPEEFINAMPYDYGRPPDDAPFGVSFEGAPNPFNDRTHVVRIGIQGKRVPVDQRKSVHLTFLVDTSGSMSSDDKLGLVKYALQRLTEELVDGDTVSIVAYAGSAGLVLPPTPMSRKSEILSALSRLSAGGSTAMGQGIALAYQQAEASYQEGAVNRVVLLSDGDANVGVTSHEALVEMIHGYAQRGIALTTAGFGTGNYKDTMMEQLADKGDGNYYYIDSQKQAERVFVDHLTGTLVVIAKDVKIQVQWDPQQVVAYRLIGYENRDIADEDFRDDAVDAGEIGSGHRVTALYEVALHEGASLSRALGTVAIRNKAPGPDSPATERSYTMDAESLQPSLSETSRDFRIALSAAYFAEALRDSPHLHEYGLREIASVARGALRPEYPEDAELLQLIERARALSGP